MRQQLRRPAIALLLALSLFASACNENHIREAKKAAYRIQVVTDASIDTTATLFHDGVIDKSKTNQIAKALLKVNTGNKVLIDKAEAATADTPGVRADLLAQLKVIEDAVKELKAVGVLGIKSKDGSLAFDSAMAALDSSIAIIQATLSGGK
jgi:hypothetical protein